MTTANTLTNTTPGFASDLLNMVDRLIKPAVGVLCLLAIIILPVDTYEFLHEPKDYIWVHHLDINKPYWQWQYLQGSCIIFVLATFGFTLVILSYTNWRKRQLQIISRIFVIMTIIWMSLGLYQ